MKQFDHCGGVRYPIADFSPKHNRFDCSGQLFWPVQGYYTNEAWARKCAEIGYKP